MEKQKAKTEKAVFGEGCFWETEEVFREIKGVVKTTVGYMGGNEKIFPHPTYLQVHLPGSGFGEVGEIEFNPKKISYKELLGIFWKSHDPTQLNRQGPDFGKPYRSVIFYNNPKQMKEAEQSKKLEQKKHEKKIVTAIEKAGKFYRAEDYHQQYLMKRGRKTCRI